MDSKAEDTPLKDYGSFSHQPVDNDDIEGHHLDRWQHQAMYVGLHFPKQRGKKHHRRRHHRKPHDEHQEQEPSKPLTTVAEEEGGSRPSETGATPPSQRVQFILGRDDAADPEHQSHDIFCEMDELRQVNDDGEMEWKETARWVKFEEDVEEGGERWSKPHVATLSLHSLFELRKGLLTGTVMLDLDASNLFQITDLVLDAMIASKQLTEEHRDKVQEVLLSRHRHQHEKHHHGEKKGLPLIRSLADIGKRPSAKNLEGKDNHNGKGSDNTLQTTGGSQDGMKKSQSGSHLSPGRNQTAPNLHRNESSDGFPETPSQHKFNEHFLKKIPQGAEASNILVGEVDFLSNPIIAFVRLRKAELLGDLTEVPVPTRFLFILLGPTGNQARYHEIGRSIATLMSDEIFHDVAYKANGREDLLAGIDEFLDQVTVLPPGEWDPTIRIEPPKSVPSQEGRKTAAPTGSGLPNGTAVIEEEEESHGDSTLERTGRLFGGLIADVKRKVPFYPSDFKDCLHIQCVASVFFMYFACLTPIITFGGLLGAATDNNMAAMESLLAGAICGVSYHIFSGQPLTIIGSTGPVLVFETIVFNFCSDNGLDYLSFRFWIGLWIGAILLVMVAFDLSALVRYITRFTEESFAALIALIFIYEAFKKLIHILDHDPVNLHPDIPLDYTCFCEPPNGTDVDTVMLPGSNVTSNWTSLEKDDCVKVNGTMAGSGCDTPHYVADVFLFSVLLFLFTFGMSYWLKFFRNKRYFPSRVRSIISDFSVMISIVLMVMTDALVGLHTPKLDVPRDFKPTRSDRDWYINPFLNKGYWIPAAILPALLGTILIFMDQQITAVIVNRKENKLKKGSGYHLDLFVIAIQICICSVLGLPFFVAATVLSINHVRSLTRESECSAPGERPKFLGVREQRLTGIIVFIMVGLSVLMTTVLLYIPMPVLYGVFLFMGVSSLKGVQLVQRVMIMIMPAKYQPDYIFLRHVPLRRVHIFTCIQVLCLAILWVIKTIKSISIVFPLMVLAMCFVRKGLDWVFTRHELKWLDDIMPEAHKREKEEKKKQLEVEAQEKMPGMEIGVEVIEMQGGAVSIPLKDGKSLNIPVDRITFDPHTNQVNVSEEMSKSAIWKQLAANESSPRMHEYEMRKRKPSKTPEDAEEDLEEKAKKREPVKFSIADDEEESAALMGAPEIVVDPPSKNVSPDQESKA